ncbi:MAG TPA: lipid-A-disaccharide synthase [Thermoanaerobaculia bacterium]|nr:lipid-A-disaccharide synthase [Thermoanaerobaculia bacterium]
MALNLLISAGEASGDLHGARLLAALKRRRPDLSAFGMGGERLQSEGLKAIVRSDTLSVVGLFEVFEKLPALSRGLKQMRTASRHSSPDVAILIDFPDFNGFLARALHRDGIPLIYYVSPQVWAWRAGRARTIARIARRIVTLFPFEAEIYRRLGADAVCAGHPLVDDVREGLEAGPPLPHKERSRVVLLPGSRAAEVRRHWPPMREAAEALARRFDLEVAVVRAPGLPDDSYADAAERGFAVTSTGRHGLIASADLAFVASGTATLETALCGTPMVVVYKTSAASFAIGKRLVKVPWISLVNIVAGEEVVPELLQEQVHAGRLEREGAALLSAPERLAKMRMALSRVARQLGPPGGSDRAAEAILEVLEPEERRRSAGR